MHEISKKGTGYFIYFCPVCQSIDIQVIDGEDRMLMSLETEE